MGQKPSIGHIIIYRSRNGDYDIPAIITATKDTLNPKGVELGYVPDLSSGDHVHLTVFYPGKPGTRRGAMNVPGESEYDRSENVAGCYQEWDIPHWILGYDAAPRASSKPWPGSWRWAVTD